MPLVFCGVKNITDDLLVITVVLVCFDTPTRTSDSDGNGVCGVFVADGDESDWGSSNLIGVMGVEGTVSVFVFVLMGVDGSLAKADAIGFCGVLGAVAALRY